MLSMGATLRLFWWDVKATNQIFPNFANILTKHLICENNRNAKHQKAEHSYVLVF